MKQYASNTSAAGGNQYIFFSSGHTVERGRIFYRLDHPGTYSYKLFYSGVIDSTFADGSISRCGLKCPDWKILRCRIAVCEQDLIEDDLTDPNTAESLNKRLTSFQELSFSGNVEAEISDTDVISSDAVLICSKPGDLLCVEIDFQGTILPYHEETLLPVYRYLNGRWCYDRRVPMPGMIGCDRPVKAKIGFWGDSITQGIGTVPNSYRHWCALVANALPPDFACWNLGLGYGRASDAASDGTWMQKVLYNDIVCLCFGVNDILQGASAQDIMRDLLYIVRRLKASRKTVLLQTIPPFDYTGEHIRIWHEVNHYIRNELSAITDSIFDNISILSSSKDAPHKARFGGHPNEEGCALWASSLSETIQHLLKHGGHL